MTNLSVVLISYSQNDDAIRFNDNSNTNNDNNGGAAAAFSSLARILGEFSTIRFLPALFLFRYLFILVEISSRT